MNQIMTQDLFNKITSDFKASETFTNATGMLEMLKGRWLDEREYEDFKEYIAAFTKTLEPDMKLVKMTRGFQVVVELASGILWNVSVSTRELKWKFTYKAK